MATQLGNFSRKFLNWVRLKLHQKSHESYLSAVKRQAFIARICFNFDGRSRKLALKSFHAKHDL